MRGTSYLVVAIIALVVVAIVFVFLLGRRPRRISPLSSIALAFVVAGIAFGASRWVGYTFIGIGVTLAVADALGSSRKGR